VIHPEIRESIMFEHFIKEKVGKNIMEKIPKVFDDLFDMIRNRSYVTFETLLTGVKILPTFFVTFLLNILDGTRLPKMFFPTTAKLYKF